VQEALRGRADVQLVVVGPGTPAELRRYRDLLGLTMPVLSDPEWSAYRSFAFGRAGVRETVLAPRHWLAYARLIAKGRRPERPRQDVFELGGDVLLDASGRIVWIYRSRVPDDRPSADEILAAVERYASSSST
jgi:peroxiredoxin